MAKAKVESVKVSWLATVPTNTNIYVASYMVDENVDKTFRNMVMKSGFREFKKKITFEKPMKNPGVTVALTGLHFGSTARR